MSKENGFVLNRQNTRSYRRDLLKLNTKEIIKQCKSQNIPITSSKADMVTKLVQKQRSSLKTNSSSKTKKKSPSSPIKTKPVTNLKISVSNTSSKQKKSRNIKSNRTNISSSPKKKKNKLKLSQSTTPTVGQPDTTIIEEKNNQKISKKKKNKSKSANFLIRAIVCLRLYKFFAISSSLYCLT